MDIDGSLNAFKAFLAKQGLHPDELKSAQAVSAMAEFYAQIRCDGVDAATDGDMLLFEWGTYDWGGGEQFEFSMTRQFSVPAPKSEGAFSEEEAITQLRVLLRFHPTDAFAQLKSGTIWCQTPAQGAEFAKMAANHPATQATRDQQPDDVEIVLEPI